MWLLSVRQFVFSVLSKANNSTNWRRKNWRKGTLQVENIQCSDRPVYSHRNWSDCHFFFLSFLHFRLQRLYNMQKWWLQSASVLADLSLHFLHMQKGAFSLNSSQQRIIPWFNIEIFDHIVYASGYEKNNLVCEI